MTTQRTALAASCLTVFCAALAFGAPQEELRSVQVRVSSTLTTFLGNGGNTTIFSGPGGVFMIDAKYAPGAEDLDAAIDAVTDGELRFLVNTHWHTDHTGGDEYFGREATIVAHENVRRRLAGEPGVRGRANERVEGTPSSLPVVTYQHGLRFHLNGETLELAHYGPGHTDGDTVVWFPDSKVVHAADVFFENQYPYVDASSGGSTTNLLAVLDAILARVGDDWTVIPGHGEVSDPATLRAYREMIEVAVGRVREALAVGDDVDTMLENGLLAEFDERWGKGTFMTPRRFLENLSAELAE